MGFKLTPIFRRLAGGGSNRGAEPRYRSDMGIARSGGHLEPIPRPSDLDNFEGSWVAVLDGVVVAQAPSSRALVYEVRKLGKRYQDAVAQYVPRIESSYMVGMG